MAKSPRGVGVVFSFFQPYTRLWSIRAVLPRQIINSRLGRSAEALTVHLHRVLYTHVGNGFIVMNPFLGVHTVVLQSAVSTNLGKGNLIPEDVASYSVLGSSQLQDSKSKWQLEHLLPETKIFVNIADFCNLYDYTK